MALRLDRLHNRRHLHLHDRSDWCNLPYLFSRGQQSVFRYLGGPLASVQPSCHGVYLVWGSIVDWRYAHLPTPYIFSSPIVTGECVTLMLRSIWTKYEDLPNSMPASSGTNTRDFVGFFLFWVCSLPAIWFPVHQIRHLFTVKAFFVPVAGVTFFVWAIVRAHGIGPIVHQPSSKSGGALGWAMIQGIMSSIANFVSPPVVLVLYRQY